MDDYGGYELAQYEAWEEESWEEYNEYLDRLDAEGEAMQQIREEDHD